MEKIIFKKLYIELLKNFLIILFSLSIFIWLVQAVNFLDIISEDGHGIGVYFQYTFLNLPKILSKTYLLSYFLAIYYVLAKYERTNQLLVFWTFGISKTVFFNKLLKISSLFFIFSFILYFVISPSAQNESRSLIRNSDLDFFTSLIKPKKFIDTVEDLTFYVDKKNNDQIQKIILKDKTNENKVQIIIAEEGEIISDSNVKSLSLINGKMINSNVDNKLTVVNFKETAIDLRKYQTKTTTTQKIQELSSIKILKCVLILMDFNFTQNYKTTCNKDIDNEYYKELYKRLCLPFFIFIIAPIAAFTTLGSNYESNHKIHKYLFFAIGIFLIIFSEISLTFISKSILINSIVLLSYPTLFISLVLLFKYQNKINY